jgi:hypothetical protein
MRSSTLLSTALLCGISLAHFEVKYPDSIGFKDDDEGESPCGGFTPDLSKDKLVDFHVGGEAIALRSTHQQGNWLFRVTLNEKADGDWEQVFPIVQQSGLGDFCQPQVTVPEKYAGKKGWVNVVSSAVDGLLYQVRPCSKLHKSMLTKVKVHRCQLRQRQGRSSQRLQERNLGESRLHR